MQTESPQRFAALWVARAAVPVAGAWAWFAAQWLTSGVTEHVHAAGPAPITHLHDWTASGLALTGALLLCLIAARSVLHRNDDVALTVVPDRRTTALLTGSGVLAYGVLELAEQLAQPEHSSPLTLLAIASGLLLTGLFLATLAVLAVAVVGGVTALLDVLQHPVAVPSPRTARRDAWSVPRPPASHVQATSRRRRGPPARGVCPA